MPEVPVPIVHVSGDDPELTRKKKTRRSAGRKVIVKAKNCGRINLYINDERRRFFRSLGVDLDSCSRDDIWNMLENVASIMHRSVSGSSRFVPARPTVKRPRRPRKEVRANQVEEDPID